MWKLLGIIQTSCINSYAEKERDTYIDFLKGLAIILVVGTHTYNLNNSVSCIIIREILTCAVPVFLALSGYMLANKDLTDTHKRKTFWKKQITKIYIPTLIWSIPYMALSIHSGHSLLGSIIMFFICGYSIYYYIAVSVQNYLLLPIIQKHLTSFKPYLVITIISLLSISYMSLYYGLSLPLIIGGLICLQWIWFFFLGVKLRDIDKDYELFYPVAICLVGIILAVFETYFWINFVGGGMEPVKYLVISFLQVLFYYFYQTNFIESIIMYCI